ncbi:Hypp3161 [Branchiostoma lanceolatum]|uniref:Hypp3161 protein n=1 Tax=Branchiostoma lanceolatum TaxID=7740 RepID=A0A8K0ET33_BRALA|nr:Hypp3161 [Branchiostoma lanceolatum]
MADSTMRSKLSVHSPRSRLEQPHFLQAFLEATVKQQVDSAVGETLSELLWKENFDMAGKAWDTQYIQGMAFGTLDPRAFGHYTVQDAAYCKSSTDNLKFLVDKMDDDSLKKFFEGRYESYKRYTKELYDQWFLKPDGADLGKAAKWYVDLEYKVAQEGGLYYLVAMIPCLRLWPYLAKKMKAEDGNIYKFWIDENGSFHGAEKVEKVVNAHASSIDSQKASRIYRKCMYGEVNFFRSACGQPLLNIPTDQ